MDTGVHDSEVACFKANSIWTNDIGKKDLSNRPIYAVLNTHNLDMILCYGLWYAFSSKRFRWPPIFFTFLI